MTIELSEYVIDAIADAVVKKMKEPCEDAVVKKMQEPCEDCISRKAALEAFGLSEKSREYGGDYSGYDILMKYEIQDILEALPPVTPQPKIGHWKRVELGMFDSVSIRWECSECKKSDRFRSNFCFNCGAKMESEVEE